MTEEIKKEADEVYGKYFDIWVNSDMTIKLEDFIKIVIQDRQSVLDILYKTGCVECQSKNDELVESLAKQIEYLKTKLK